MSPTSHSRRASRPRLAARVLLGLALALLAVACTRVGSGRDGTGGARHPWTHPDELRVGMIGAPNTLDPILSTQEFETQVIALVFDPLIAADPQGNDVPILAARVPTLANGDVSPDGLRIVYHLRHGVSWQDGAPFSSHDVAFTWRAIMNPNSTVSSRHGYDVIERIDTPDPWTAVFHLKRRFGPAVQTYFAHSDIQYFVMPAHLLERYASLNGIPFNSAPIGTGPYKLVRWARGDRFELTANDRYFLGKPKIRNVVIHLVGDENTLAQQVRSHEIDWFIEATPRVYPQLRGIPGVDVRLVPTNATESIMFDTERAPWNDARVRRAVGLAIDKGELVRTITSGTTIAATEDQPRSLWSFDPGAGTDEPDVAEARRLLDEAGWKVGPSGIRTKNGRPLQLELASRADVLTERNIGVVVASMLRNVGIDVAQKSYLTSIYYAPYAEGGILARGKFDAGLMVWYAGIDPDDSSQLTCRERPPQGYDWSRYCTARMDDAQRLALDRYDRPTRKRAYATIQRLLARDAPYVYLWWPRQIEAINDDLHGFRPNGIVEDWNAYQWSL